MYRFNLITILLIIVFLTPIIAGAARSFSRDRVFFSIKSLLGSIEFILGMLLSIYLTKRIFIENTGGVYRSLYNIVPGTVREYLSGKDVLTYLVVVPVLLSIILSIFRLISIPMYNKLLVPATEGAYKILSSMNAGTRRVIGGIARVPKAVFAVFMFGLLLNFFTYYYSSPLLSKWMNESTAYNVLYKNALYPVLNSSIAKEIPVIVNDSFSRAVGGIIPGDAGTGIPEQIAQKLGGKVRVIEYFNGVTLDEAVKSNPEIDATAAGLVKNADSDREKAYLIYKWVSKNIKYDYDKAARISKDTTGEASGAIIAYKTRKGVCFDYSTIYIAMCRAAGLKVQLVTGLGYSGVSWGDHAWNRVFSAEENRWINVDATFGTSADYFDRANFGVDHRDAEIQGEW